MMMSSSHSLELLALWNCVVVVGSVIKDRYYDIQSPYGRFTNAADPSTLSHRFELRRDYPVNSRRAWFIFESPNVLIGTWVIATHDRTHSTAVGEIAASLFMFHYLIRTFVYSALTKGAKSMPLEIVFWGMMFTMVNGFVQVKYHLSSEFRPQHGVYSFRFLLGLALFAFGFVVNQTCDHHLRSLRKNTSDGTYYIPNNVFFRRLSAANLVGEIVEWSGYFLMTGSYPALSFAVSTLFNVGNRAIGTHKWYLTKFKDTYPKDRYALIPYVY